MKEYLKRELLSVGLTVSGFLFYNCGIESASSRHAPEEVLDGTGHSIEVKCTAESMIGDAEEDIPPELDTTAYENACEHFRVMLDLNDTYHSVEEGCCTKSESGSLACIANYFETPSPSPRGLAWDGKYLWNAFSKDVDGFGRIYQLTTTGSQVYSFVPSECDQNITCYPTDLTWREGFLWSADTNNDRIYGMDSAGEVIDSFESPDGNPLGLAWDGENFFVAEGSKIHTLKADGEVVSDCDFPSLEPQGLAWDGTYLWSTGWGDNHPGRIFKSTPTCETVDSFYSPEKYPSGITWGNQYLWVADYGYRRIHQLEIISVK